jgi:hypothetical protein
MTEQNSTLAAAIVLVVGELSVGLTLCADAAALQVSKMPKWKVKGVDPDTRTAINTEWGCYGSELLPRVKEDLELDAASGPQQGEEKRWHCSCFG